MAESDKLYVKLGEPLDIDWAAEGDQLIHNLFNVMSELVLSTGSGFSRHDPTDDEPFFAFIYRVTSPTLRSELLLVPVGATAFQAYVAVDSNEQVDQVTPWDEGLRLAVDRLTTVHPIHEWYAYIGPVDFLSGSPARLVEAAEVGGLKIYPATTAFAEARPGPPPSLNAARISISYPVVVEGTDTGYSWSIAQGTANERLNKLCALLSAAFDSEWQIRNMPDLGSSAGRILPRSWMGYNDDSSTGNVLQTDVRPPEWLSDAWDRLTDEVLARALHAFHEAIALEAEHPSFALIAYVSVIEGLGSKLVPLRKCDCCDTCPVQVGAGKRFRKALQLVLPRKQADQLGSAYEARSSTAHEGRLHGHEIAGDAIGILRVFAPPAPNDQFRWGALREIRAASRAVLLHFLRSEPTG